MINARKLLPLGGFMATLALAGCQMAGPPARPDVSMRSQGVEGTWAGSDGVAVSTLRNGAFESRSRETDEVLTRGSYRNTSARSIELNFYSVKTRENTSAACMQVDRDRMNCTLANGTQFVLRRQQTGMS